MMDRKKSVFLSTVFFVFLFAVSIIPVTATGTPAVNSDAQTSSSIEEDKAVSISTGTTSGTFSDGNDIKYYLLDVTPGLWNITVETDNVSLDADLFQQMIINVVYLDDNYTLWMYYDDISLGTSDIDSFLLEVPSDGQLMLEVDPDYFSHEYLVDSWHFKIYVSHIAPTAGSGTVNIDMEPDDAKAYSFSVANTGLYNMSYEANATYMVDLYSERGDLYTEFGLSSDFELLFLETGITYYYFVFSGGADLSLNITLNQIIYDATIAETGTTTLDFAADEWFKIVLWEGSPEGLYEITADTENIDVGLAVTSLRSTGPFWNFFPFWIFEPGNALVADDLWLFGPDVVGEENMTLFLRDQVVEDWWAPLPDGSHFESVIASAETLGGSWTWYTKDLWSSEYLAIVLVNKGSSGMGPDIAASVGLTVDQVPVDTISFDTPTTVTINETSSDTCFKVLQFETEINYEYDITLAPDAESHDGGVGIEECAYVGTYGHLIHGLYYTTEIGGGDYNFTTYNEVLGGEPGSNDPITSYLILGVYCPGTDWGTITVTVDEVEPTEIEVDDGVTTTYTKDDEYTIYKVELKADTPYNIEMELSEDSVGFVVILLNDDKMQRPDVSSSGIVFEEAVAGESPKNDLTLYSHSDQTLYLLVLESESTGSTFTFTVSTIEEPFSLEGLMAYLLIAAIPLALIIGLLIGKKTA